MAGQLHPSRTVIRKPARYPHAPSDKLEILSLNGFAQEQIAQVEKPEAPEGRLTCHLDVRLYKLKVITEGLAEVEDLSTTSSKIDLELSLKKSEQNADGSVITLSGREIKTLGNGPFVFWLRANVMTFKDDKRYPIVKLNAYLAKRSPKLSVTALGSQSVESSEEDSKMIGRASGFKAAFTKPVRLMNSKTATMILNKAVQKKSPPLYAAADEPAEIDYYCELQPLP